MNKVLPHRLIVCESDKFDDIFWMFSQEYDYKRRKSWEDCVGVRSQESISSICTLNSKIKETIRCQRAAKICDSLVRNISRLLQNVNEERPVTKKIVAPAVSANQPQLFDLWFPRPSSAYISLANTYFRKKIFKHFFAHS